MDDYPKLDIGHRFTLAGMGDTVFQIVEIAACQIERPGETECKLNIVALDVSDEAI